jgi:hypothetical protein
MWVRASAQAHVIEIFMRLQVRPKAHEGLFPKMPQVASLRLEYFDVKS